MTDYAHSVSTVFDLQRSALEQSQQAFESGVEANQRLAASAVDAVGTVGDAQARSVEAFQAAVENYFDVLEASVPGAEGQFADAREAVDEQFDEFLAAHGEAVATLETNLEEAVESNEEFADEFLASLDEALGLLVESHETLEDQTVEGVEEFQSQAEELQSQVEEQAEELAEEFQSQTEQVVDQATSA